MVPEAGRRGQEVFGAQRSLCGFRGKRSALFLVKQICTGKILTTILNNSLMELRLRFYVSCHFNPRDLQYSRLNRPPREAPGRWF